MDVLDYETRLHIVKLHEQGFPPRAIAERFTLRPSDVERFVKAGMPIGTPRPDESQGAEVRALRAQGLPLLAISLRTGLALPHVIAECDCDRAMRQGDPEIPQRAAIMVRGGHGRIETCAITGFPK